MTATVSEGVIEQLRGTFRGEIVQPGDPSYETARLVWNGAIDKRPAVIARCTGTADVIAAVKCARSERAGRRDPRRRPQQRRPRDDRRRDGHRLLPDEGNPRRSRLADGDGATRRALGRARPRDPGVRARGDGRRGVGHRHRRPDARRRHRLAEADVRTDLRQPAVGRPRHGRGRAGSRQREGERRALLGRPRSRGQLRRRDPVRVSPAPASGRCWRASFSIRSTAPPTCSASRETSPTRRPTRSR